MHRSVFAVERSGRYLCRLLYRSRKMIESNDSAIWSFIRILAKHNLYIYDSRGTRNIDCKEKSNGRLIIIISRFECIGWFFSIKVALTRSIVYISISLVTRSRATISWRSTILRQKFEEVSECTARLFKFYWSHPRKEEKSDGRDRNHEDEWEEVARRKNRGFFGRLLLSIIVQHADNLPPLATDGFKSAHTAIEWSIHYHNAAILSYSVPRPPCKTWIHVQSSGF